MNAFTIKDLENLTGIKAHTIRIWEQRYSFLKPQRSNTNIRYYHADELKAVLNIALLNKYGYKISHIDKMTPEIIREKILTLTASEAQQERIINTLLHFMIDLDAPAFEELLDDYIISNGIDKTINYLVFPFLHKIGILWMTDHIRIAQEHLVSNIIRHKLIMGIENASNLQISNNKVVLFLPEGEHHEIGLLYMYYLLKIRGVQVLYLGADVPEEELEFVAKLKTPDYVYTHLTSIATRFNFEKYIQALHSRINVIPIVISGHVAQNYTKKVPSGVELKKTLNEVLETLAN